MNNFTDFLTSQLQTIAKLLNRQDILRLVLTGAGKTEKVIARS